MLTLSEMADLAARATGRAVDAAHARETLSGWFFPYVPEPEPRVGSNGVIINKLTGKAFVLGSAYAVERDIRLYDKGYQFEVYALVVLGFSTLEAAVEAIRKLSLTKIEPEYSGGTVWRVPKPLTTDDIRARLDRLPAIFGAVPLYFVVEELERARQRGILRVEVLECPKLARNTR
jgi:hypothetical protein